MATYHISHQALENTILLNFFLWGPLKGWVLKYKPHTVDNKNTNTTKSLLQSLCLAHYNICAHGVCVGLHLQVMGNQFQTPSVILLSPHLPRYVSTKFNFHW
jgi:hypothetical protein